MSLLIALLLVQAAPAASSEAEALGARLARGGTLATLLPVIGKKETEELVAAHPELSPADQARLRAAAQRTLDAGSARIMAAFGRSYARHLTAAELRTLVAQTESAPARKLHRVLPQVMAEAMGTLGAIDFKRDTLAAFCHDTGKLCPAPARP